MAHKRKGQLTVSGEWAKHLRPLLRRQFWKAERTAVAKSLRTESPTSARMQNDTGTVEELLAQVEALPPSSQTLELWVPEILTLKGIEVQLNIAMAVVLDRVLEHGLFPDGFTAQPGGRMYRYRSE